MTLTCCVDCGEPCEGPRCTDCRPATDRTYARAPKTSSTSRGYDSAWRRLSERARRLQPWCSDCGSVEDLTGEHTAEAWQRKADGLPIRLQDVDVLCRACNGARGAPGDEGFGDRRTTPAVQAKFGSHSRSLTGHRRARP